MTDMPTAVFVTAHGGPEVMRLQPSDPGLPGRGQVRIHVSAAGVNFIDTYQRTGHYPGTPPFVLGLEGAGVVESIGPDVGSIAPGDRVAWSSVPGSYATDIIAPADRLIAIPTAVSDDIACAAMLQGMTAHYLVYGCRETKPGDVALVHAGAGGVGLLLTQMLKQVGARVITTVSTREKEVLSRAAGAEDVVLYNDLDFTSEVRRLTEGRGVDVVYDGIGATTFEGSLKSLRPRGLMVLYGGASGPVPPFDPLQLQAHGSIFLTRPSLAHYIATRSELELRAAAVLDAVATSTLDIRIGARYPLAEAAAAHRALEGRETTGKVLLTP